MKNKTKLVLGLSALLAVTAGAATTSTLAWFTTTRSVTVNFSNLKVNTGSGSLKVKYVSGTNTESDNTTYGSTAAVTGTTSGVADGKDISGDGTTFYRPTWNATKLTTADTDIADAYASYYTAKSIDAVEAAGNFITFKIKLMNGETTTTQAVDVFLGKGTAIAAGDDNANSTKAANGTRVAVLAGTSLRSMWQGNTEDSAYNYIKSSSTSTDFLYGYTTHNFTLGDCTTDFKSSPTDGLYTGTDSVNAWHDSNAFDTINSKTDGKPLKGTYIGRIPGGDELELTINMWLEGTSKYIVDSLEGALVKADLSFVSVDVAA